MLRTCLRPPIGSVEKELVAAAIAGRNSPAGHVSDFALVQPSIEAAYDPAWGRSGHLCGWLKRNLRLPAGVPQTP